MVVRWPGVFESGTIINDMIAHNDWLPTFAAAAGEPEIVQKMKDGYTVGDKTFKVHLDGYNYLPFFKGEVEECPRDEYLYFFADGSLNAIRWDDWKVHFAVWDGNIAMGERRMIGWPMIIHLRADPFEKAPLESDMYLRWYGEQMWLFVPVQQQIKEFLATIPDYPFQEGAVLNAANINYQTLKAASAMKRLEQLESLSPPVGR